MMLGLSRAMRLLLLFGAACAVIWLCWLAFFYRSMALDVRVEQPVPADVAALVDLIENAAPDDRTKLLQALRVGGAEVRLSGRHAGLEPALSDMDLQTLRSYQAALAGRSVALRREQQPAFDSIFLRHLATKLPAMQLSIALQSGETLEIVTKSSPLITSMGVPVGYAAGFLGTLVGLLALIVMHRETRPLARLVAALDRTDLAGTPTELPQSGTNTPEVRAVISAFNRLQARLGLVLRNRMAMIGGISHDVRTFATHLRLRIELIPQPMERERAIVDIEDMIRLLDDALLASKLGANELSEELIELADLVEADANARLADLDRMALRISEQARTACVIGDRLALRRVIANLIDNGLKYAPHVWIFLQVDHLDVVLWVDDDGPGIPADRREDLLEPFVRLDESRNRGQGGAGLGLAVVRNLVALLGGKTRIDDAPAGGARVEIRLPLFVVQT